MDTLKGEIMSLISVNNLTFGYMARSNSNKDKILTNSKKTNIMLL